MHSLRQRFSDFMTPHQQSLQEQCFRAGVPTIRFNLLKIWHFFDRIEERDIPLGVMGSVFTKLINERFCILLYALEMSSYENTMKRRTDLHVSYKEHSFPFSVIKTNRDYLLTPRTVLSRGMGLKTEAVQVIDIDLDTGEFSFSLFGQEETKLKLDECVSE